MFFRLGVELLLLKYRKEMFKVVFAYNQKASSVKCSGHCRMWPQGKQWRDYEKLQEVAGKLCTLGISAYTCSYTSCCDQYPEKWKKWITCLTVKNYNSGSLKVKCKEGCSRHLHSTGNWFCFTSILIFYCIFIFLIYSLSILLYSTL